MANLQDLFDTEKTDWLTQFETKKQHAQIDLLAQSVAMHRCKQAKVAEFLSFNTNELLSHITPEDVIEAQKIRDHYSKRFTWFAIQGRHLSPYRQDLCNFVNSDGLEFIEKTLPLVYRLPEFYHYDLEFSEVMKDMNTKVEFETMKVHTDVKTLTPVHKFFVNKRQNKKNEYWLKDEVDQLYVLDVSIDNPVLNLWEREFAKDKIAIRGTFRPRRRDEYSFFSTEKWNLDI